VAGAEELRRARSGGVPAQVFTIRRRVETERDFDYYLERGTYHGE